MNIVISQSMLFPWVGMLEQVKLADVFIHYDDVQFSKGSFVNRVQLKWPSGSKWLTVPLVDLHLGQRINEVKPAETISWKQQHFELLEQSFENAPYAKDALEIAEKVYRTDYEDIGSLSRASLLALVHYFGFEKNTRFLDVVSLNIGGSSSERVLNVVKKVEGTTYITGHGAANYLDHQLFEQAGIDVRYMQYQRKPYPQHYGAFNPYVTGLDLVAHCGPAGAEMICSGALHWRDFILS
jgi:hypothetical protein